MTTRIAFDLSGLAWRYRTGVQNLYWAFVDAWARQSELRDAPDVLFYDRSGIFNRHVAAAAPGSYAPSAPAWWPDRLRRPLQAAIRLTGALNPNLQGRINHVWNWNIFHPTGCRGSITIPDVLPLEFPQWFDAKFRRLTHQSLRFAAERAEFVFAISNHVKQRILETTTVAPERVRVVYPGIDSHYFVGIDSGLVEPTLRRHGLTRGRYLLSSGFLDPRKNLARQLQAFLIHVQRNRSDLRYALTGLKTALSGELLQLIESPELRDRVVFLGYVPQDELKTLMSQSAALMYCSIAEGFGLPIIEAMAVGAPVITSATSSMQEVASSRARLVNPLEPEDIAAAIDETLACSIEDRDERIKLNQAYAREFTIDNWLAGHLHAFASGATT